MENSQVDGIPLRGMCQRLQRLTEDGRRPKIFCVFVSCVDSFIGTDREYVMEELRQMEPDIIFFDLAVDPINRDTMPPLVRLHNTITALFEKTENAAPTRTVNWIGNYLKPEETHPLVQKLQQNGLTSRHLLDCTSVEELRLMGNSTANIAMTAMGLPAVKKLKEKFGTPYYNLVNPDDPDSLTEEALLAL